MVSTIITLGGILGAILAFGIGGYYFNAAVDQAWRLFPASTNREEAARAALITYIWSSNVLAASRRSYLLFHIYGCIGMACLFAVLVARGNSIEIVISGGVLAIVTVLTVRCWRIYRRRVASA